MTTSKGFNFLAFKREHGHNHMSRCTLFPEAVGEITQKTGSSKSD